MYSYCKQPIIFPFSNPTHYAEAEPKDLINWTEGNAIVATGSPFEDVIYNGTTYPISQGNNVYAFPGIGLGVVVSGARAVTKSMFSVAAKTIEEMVTQEDLDKNMLLPPLSKLRETSKQIAYNVWKETDRLGINRNPFTSESMKHIEDKMWTPEYLSLIHISEPTRPY